MKKSAIKIIPEDFEYYLSLVDDIELSEAFDQSLKQIDELDLAKIKRIGLAVYAEGKWTLHQIFQHLIDWERIFCYRALIFARGVGVPPDGFDQTIMAANSNADQRSIESLIAELRAVRQTTKTMFESFSDEILMTDCKFYKYEMPVLGMGFAILTHQLHHFKVIEERYFPLDK